MKIETQQIYDSSWFCSDDNYDGAPDAGKQCVGYGETEFLALQDYLANFEEHYSKN